jgi:hypothetical protein
MIPSSTRVRDIRFTAVLSHFSNENHFMIFMLYARPNSGHRRFE